MTGQYAFKQIVDFTNSDSEPRKLISQEDFELWQKDYTWDALHGLRYGQSFCNRFGITDNLLYYTTWPCEQMDDYIEKNYLDRSGI
jgi:hypothetical protein